MNLQVIVVIIVALCIGYMIGSCMSNNNEREIIKRTRRDNMNDNEKMEGGAPTDFLRSYEKNNCVVILHSNGNAIIAGEGFDNNGNIINACNYYSQIEIYGGILESGHIFLKCGVESSKLTSIEVKYDKESSERLKPLGRTCFCCAIATIRVLPTQGCIGWMLGAYLTLLEQVGHALIDVHIRCILGDTERTLDAISHGTAWSLNNIRCTSSSSEFYVMNPDVGIDIVPRIVGSVAHILHTDLCLLCAGEKFNLEPKLAVFFANNSFCNINDITNIFANNNELSNNIRQLIAPCIITFTETLMNAIENLYTQGTITENHMVNNTVMHTGLVKTLSDKMSNISNGKSYDLMKNGSYNVLQKPTSDKNPINISAANTYHDDSLFCNVNLACCVSACEVMRGWFSSSNKNIYDQNIYNNIELIVQYLEAICYAAAGNQVNIPCLNFKSNGMQLLDNATVCTEMITQSFVVDMKTGDIISWAGFINWLRKTIAQALLGMNRIVNDDNAITLVNIIDTLQQLLDLRVFDKIALHNKR